MKENTKFLWMYVGILFSFALILIVFAGLSQSNDSEETKGLQNDITTLSEQNTLLQSQIKEKDNEIKILHEQISLLTNEKNTLTAQNGNLYSESEAKRLNDVILMDAIELFDSGKKQSAKNKIADLNQGLLTEAQNYLYNIIAQN